MPARCGLLVVRVRLVRVGSLIGHVRNRVETLSSSKWARSNLLRTAFLDPRGVPRRTRQSVRRRRTAVVDRFSSTRGYYLSCLTIQNLRLFAGVSTDTSSPHSRYGRDANRNASAIRRASGKPDPETPRTFVLSPAVPRSHSRGTLDLRQRVHARRRTDWSSLIGSAAFSTPTHPQAFDSGALMADGGEYGRTGRHRWTPYWLSSPSSRFLLSSSR